MEVPGLGVITKDERYGSYQSEPIAVPMLGGKPCRIMLEGYGEDKRQEDFHVAIANFLSGGPEVLREADEPLFRYYKDSEEWWLEDENNQPIKPGNDLWQHVRLGNKASVRRRPYGDKGIYISIECGCDWEEHGLQIVLKNGLKVNKLGPYHEHLTNSDAFDDESLEDVVYPQW